MNQPIVYSTTIPENVLAAYSRWARAGNGLNISKNGAWVKFCNECEHAHLHIIDTVKRINK